MMRTYIVAIQIKRLVQAETPEAAQQFAEWVYAGLRESVPHVDPHPLGCIVLGPAGGDLVQVLPEERPASVAPDQVHRLTE